MDTRFNPLPVGTTNIDVVGLARTTCGYSLSAPTAYSLNLTLAPSGNPVDFATLWPQGAVQPATSTMNSLDGRTKANAAIVGAGVDGGVSLYLAGATDVIIDLNGYFTIPGQSTLAFYPLVPCRVMDTRSTEPLTANSVTDILVMTNPCMQQVPGTVRPAAYSANFTAVPVNLGDPLRYLSVWPTGSQPQTPVSTLNNLTGTNVANAGIVEAGTTGNISVYVTDTTNLIVDINGFFGVSLAHGASYYSMQPCRVIDTRSDNPTDPFSGALTVDVADSPCQPSAAANAYVLNATVVPSPGFYFLSLYPNGLAERPLVSTLNAIDGMITSNMAIVPTLNGSIDAFAMGTTNMVLDLSGYFAPASN